MGIQDKNKGQREGGTGVKHQCWAVQQAYQGCRMRIPVWNNTSNIDLCMCVYVTCVHTCRGQKRTPDPLEQELQGVVSHLTTGWVNWVLWAQQGFPTTEPPPCSLPSCDANGPSPQSAPHSAPTPVFNIRFYDLAALATEQTCSHSDVCLS